MRILPTFLVGLGFVFANIFRSAGANGNLQNSSSPPKICDRVEIWYWSQFEHHLRGCTVIEGSLKINILFDFIDVDVASLSFPELREITGFLLLFSTEGIISLQKLFPNLEIIRGQELVENYALVISKMPNLADLGLLSLTGITNGGVWIVGNSQLCFVESIDWASILGRDSDIVIRNNGPHCSNTCPESCPHCWNGVTCQVPPSLKCPHCEGRSCFGPDHGECCHVQCAGRCSGRLLSDCHVCKNVGLISPDAEGNVRENCLQICPAPYYEYLGRRCLTRNECLRTTATAPSNHPTHPKETLHAKLYQGRNTRNQCVLDCPLESYLDSPTICKPCNGGRCAKICPGGTVDTIEALRMFSGCTQLSNPGHLRIHIRTHSGGDGGATSGTGSLVSLLKEHLGNIEIIEDYLFVSHTFAMYSLDFLESLKIIQGKVLSDNKHALVIKSNENMVDLWSKRNVTISNHDARIMFHYNPRLCPEKIYNFLSASGISSNLSMNPMDIGITNGDKVTCNTKTLRVNVAKLDSTSFNLTWENFARNLTAPSYLLNYEIHYKETVPGRVETKLELRDPCGQDGWNILDVSPLRAEDTFNNGFVRDEQVRIENLLPFTDYAFYVKAVVLPGSLYALNNNTGAESGIQYAKTLPGIPEGPGDLTLDIDPPRPEEISARWTPPLRTNGPVTHFKVLLTYLGVRNEEENQSKYVTSASTSADFSGHCGDFEFRNNEITLGTSEKPISGQFSSTTAKPSHRKSRVDENDPQKTHGIQESAMVNIILGNHLFTGVGLRPPFASDDITLEMEVDGGDDEGKVNPSQHHRARRSLSDPELTSTPRNIDDNYNLVQEFDVPIIHPSPDVYKLTFRHLRPFTYYYVEVKACRNETCSDRRENLIRTPPSPTADLVSSPTITTSIVNSTLQLTWGEPSSPNGGILAYIITITRATGPTSGSSRCISREDFLSQGKSYTFPEPLLIGGNYSVVIRSKSHAWTSEPSSPIFISVADTTPTNSVTWILLLLLLVGFLLTGGGIHCYFLYRKSAQRKARAMLVTSANPEYTPPVYIPPEWEIDREGVTVYRKETPLGAGSFGTVYRGLWRKKGEVDPGSRSRSSSSSWVGRKSRKVGESVVCAVKELRDDTPPQDKADLMKEALLMTRLNCAHVVKLFGIVSLSHPILVVMEYMPNKDLRSYLISIRESSGSCTCGPGCSVNDPLLNPGHDASPTSSVLTPAFIYSIAASVADGMAYIHSRGFVHRDIAARNCMIDSNLRVKVGDFGLSKEMSDYYRLRSRGRFPVRWMAPECFLDNLLSKESDVWAYGVLLYEIVNLGGMPYPQFVKVDDKTSPNLKVMEYVCNGGTLEMGLPPTSPALITEIAKNCWKYRRDARPTFFQILERLMPHAESDAFKSVSFYHSEEGICAKKKELFDTAYFSRGATTTTTAHPANLDIVHD